MQFEIICITTKGQITRFDKKRRTSISCIRDVSGELGCISNGGKGEGAPSPHYLEVHDFCFIEANSALS